MIMAIINTNITDVNIDWSKYLEIGVQAYDQQTIQQTAAPWILGLLVLIILTK